MSVAFVFTGQGSQTVGMGKSIYDRFSVARDVFKEVDDVLKMNLTNIILNGPQDVLTNTENAQPAIMCVSTAILKVLQKESKNNIENLCDYVAGHSLGEYTALCASGVLSLKDTANLLKIRGKAFANTSSGGMCALLGGDIASVEKLLENIKSNNNGIIQIANDNAVGQIVISGDIKLIDIAVSIATEFGFKKAVKLNVSGAFHSSLMQPAVEVMKPAISGVEMQQPKVNFISNVDAKITKNIDDIKNNLVLQISNSVKWRETMLLLAKEGVNKIVEIGPNKVLSPMVNRTLENVEAIALNDVESIEKYLL